MTERKRSPGPEESPAEETLSRLSKSLDGDAGLTVIGTYLATPSYSSPER